jgi:WS/DGAT/MGAT family acyltransferase
MHLTAALFDLSPEPREEPPPPAWEPEPEPSSRDLLREATGSLFSHPVQALMNGVDTVRRSPALAALDVGTVLSGFRSIVDMGARPTSPLDVQIGPNRRFAIADAPLQRFKEIKDVLGGTVNDVVLTVVGGALHRLLRDRREPTRGRTLRVMVPVSVQGGRDASLGNRVAPAFIDLPVGAMGPKRRLAVVREGTSYLKDSMMAMSADAIIGLGAYAPGGLLAAAARLASRGPWFNLVVSNIHGPSPADVHGRRQAGRAVPLAPARRELGALDRLHVHRWHDGVRPDRRLRRHARSAAARVRSRGVALRGLEGRRALRAVPPQPTMPGTDTPRAP